MVVRFCDGILKGIASAAKKQAKRRADVSVTNAVKLFL
jgi:hypothetical protein